MTVKRVIGWVLAVAVVEGALLLILAWLLPGLEIRDIRAALLAGAIVTVGLALAWGPIYWLSAKFHPLIFPFLSFILTGVVVVATFEDRRSDRAGCHRRQRHLDRDRRRAGPVLRHDPGGRALLHPGRPGLRPLRRAPVAAALSRHPADPTPLACSSWRSTAWPSRSCATPSPGATCRRSSAGSTPGATSSITGSPISRRRPRPARRASCSATTTASPPSAGGTRRQGA